MNGGCQPPKSRARGRPQRHPAKVTRAATIRAPLAHALRPSRRPRPRVACDPRRIPGAEGGPEARTAHVPRPLDGPDRGRRPADPHRPGPAATVSAPCAARCRPCCPSCSRTSTPCSSATATTTTSTSRRCAGSRAGPRSSCPGGSRGWRRRGTSGRSRRSSPATALTIDRVRARRRPRGALRQARAVRSGGAGHRLRRSPARAASTSRATRTCSRAWRRSPGRSMSRCSPCGAGDRPSARATWTRVARRRPPPCSGRGSRSRSTGERSIRRACGGSSPSRSTSRVGCSPTSWRSAPRTSRCGSSRRASRSQIPRR